jgi:hypothetical protein
MKSHMLNRAKRVFRSIVTICNLNNAKVQFLLNNIPINRVACRGSNSRGIT